MDSSSLMGVLAKLNIPPYDPNSSVVYQEEKDGRKYSISYGYNFEKALQCTVGWKNYHSKIQAYLKTLPADKAKDIDQKISQQDWHWDWLGKTMHSKEKSEYEWFYFEIDGVVEAACLIFYPRLSDLPPSESIFYIEFIAVAPWNRFSPLEVKRYEGLGTKLVIESIRYLTGKYKNDGRFSLHSLDQAESYYTHKLKMVHISHQDKPSLKYFELPFGEVVGLLGAVA